MKMKMIKTLSIIAITINISASVWQTTERWDDKWEASFSQWIQTNFNEEFFIQGKYEGIPTDCADAVYSSRAIYAYENGLPFKIRDWTGSNKYFTNEMNRFDRYSNPKKRLKKFLIWIFDMTNTKSLPRDTYPLRVDRETIRPGNVWVRPNRTVSRILSGANTNAQPGHADIVKEIRETGVIYFIGSTVPQALRKLKTTNGMAFLPKNNKMGLRRFKSPQQHGRNITYLNGYSLEQFTELGLDKTMNKRTLSKFKKDVIDRLKLRDESKEELFQRYADNVCAQINERVAVVKDAEEKRKYVRGKLDRCMNEREYDHYSTPSRDAKLKDVIEQLVHLKYKNTWISLKSKLKHFKKYLAPCKDLNYSKNKTINIIDATHKLMRGRMSTDPNQSLEVRWGHGSEESLGCKKY